MMRTWRTLLTLLGLSILGAGDPANSQSIGPAQESFGLPVPSGRYQPVPPSPIHATSWSVRRVTENGRKVAVPNDAVVLFDWGGNQGESLAYVYDGCEVSQRTFAWATNEVFIAPPGILIEPDGCTTNRHTAMHRALTGTFLHQFGKVIAPGTTMTLAAGKRRIEFVRRPENPLDQTAWVTTESFFKAGVGRIDGRLSFGPTTFRASDGCNSIDGTYLYIGGEIVVLSGSQTMAACDWPSFGWPGGTSEVALSTGRLTITTRSIAHKYRRITAVPIEGLAP